MKTIKKIVIFSNFCITKNKRIYLGTKKKKITIYATYTRQYNSQKANNSSNPLMTLYH